MANMWAFGGSHQSLVDSLDPGFCTSTSPTTHQHYQQDTFMKTSFYLCLTATLLLSACSSGGGVFDPECTAEKAAKSTAMKATVGVGGRCSPAEAAKDSAKRVVQ